MMVDLCLLNFLITFQLYIIPEGHWLALTTPEMNGHDVTSQNWQISLSDLSLPIIFIAVMENGKIQTGIKAWNFLNTKKWGMWVCLSCPSLSPYSLGIFRLCVCVCVHARAL